MFIVYDTTRPFRRKEVERFETFEQAVIYVNCCQPVMLQEDERYPGCADAMLYDGTLLVIEPEGFTLCGP